MSVITKAQNPRPSPAVRPVAARPIRLRALAARQARGFSLIEVLIALVILAVGLLSLAFLQVLNVRYTQSAQHRTMATNLASEMLDMMRSNNAAAKQYGYITSSDFTGVVVPAGGCVRGTDAAYLANIALWKCQVVASLPGGKGEVKFDGANQVTVVLSWSDDVGREDGKGTGVPGKTTKFEVTTLL